MKLLIAGASGFVGQRLIQHYLDKDTEITAISRNPDQMALNKIQAISWQQLSLDTIKQHDLIINLAGTNLADKRWTKERKQSIKQSRIDATKNIGHLCSQLGSNSPALFNASAIGIYPSYYQQPAPQQNESYSINCLQSQNFLMETGCAWEQATSHAIDNNVRVVHLRFGVIIGPESGMLKQLLTPFKLGLGAKIGNGKQTLTWISVEDVVKAIDFLTNISDINGPVNITAPNSVSQEAFANALAKHLKRPRLFTIPKQMIQLGFGELGNELLLKGQNIYPKKLDELGYEWKHPTIDKCFKSML